MKNRQPIKLNEDNWETISGQMARALAGMDPDMTPNERAELLRKSKIVNL